MSHLFAMVVKSEAPTLRWSTSTQQTATADVEVVDVCNLDRPDRIAGYLLDLRPLLSWGRFMLFE